MNTLFLNEYRCHCGKLLFKGIIFDATLEIKCKCCGRINKIGHIKMSNDVSQYLLIINDKGVITNASDSACNILGYESNKLIGKHFTYINPTLPKEIGDKFFGLNSVLSEEQFFQFETMHKTKEGKLIPILANYKLYKPNKKDKYVLVSMRLKGKDNHTDNTNKTECNFVNKVCDFYFDIDKNGIITLLDSSVEKFFDNLISAIDELLHKYATDDFDKANIAEIRNNLKKMKETLEKSRRYIIENIREINN